MKVYRIFLLFLFISSFFLSVHSSQKILLDKLFNELIETDDYVNLSKYDGLLEFEKGAKQVKIKMKIPSIPTKQKYLLIKLCRFV